MISHSPEETQKIADDFITAFFALSPTSGKATVVGLYGNLGAGKTAFTQCVAKTLGVNERVLSPTFVIMKVYELPHTNLSGQYKKTCQPDKQTCQPGRLTCLSHLIHIDAYRMEASDELLHLGWKEIISNPRNLILIEWPEKVADIMPEHIKIKFQTVEDENSREIKILD